MSVHIQQASSLNSSVAKLRKEMFFIFFLGFSIQVHAQTFEWYSENSTILSINPKIIQHDNQHFIMISNDDEDYCLMLNAKGRVVWQTYSTLYSSGFTDILSVDSGKAYTILGMGDHWLLSNVFFVLNKDGQILFQKQVSGKTYYPIYFCHDYTNNKLVSCGFSVKNMYVRPILEYRGFNGDTLGKKELGTGPSVTGQRIFKLDDLSGYMILSGRNDETILSFLLTDTLGNRRIEKIYGPNSSGLYYDCTFYDVCKKNGHYFVLVQISPQGIYPDNSFRRGQYIYEFDEVGDSVDAHLICDWDWDLKCSYAWKSICSTRDGGFLLGGENLIHKLDSNYQLQWERKFNSTTIITSVGQAKDGGYYGAGSYMAPGQTGTFSISQTYVFKTDSNGYIDTSTHAPQVVLYPNPFSNQLNVDLPYDQTFTITITDLQGRLCLSTSTMGSTTIDVSQLQESVYVVMVKDSAGVPVYATKLIKANE